jgi:hypothetical protein
MCHEVEKAGILAAALLKLGIMHGDRHRSHLIHIPTETREDFP